MTNRVYEMLWDCAACGTNGLLGKSQRRCPNCGSPQDERKRYFPQPGQEVAVSGHKFEGADWRCEACTTPNGAAASFCCNCGNPKDGNKQAALVADRIVKGGAVVDQSPQAQALAAAPQKKRSRTPIVIAAVAAVVVVVLAVLLLVKKDATVDVMAHVWTRSIAIERFQAVHEDSWCDQLPSGAYRVSRTREQRSTKQVANGQECHDRQKDQGDGTFKVVEECKTKYKSEPIYDDKCHYSVDRWAHARDESRTGGLKDAPTWPVVALRGGSGLGAERESGRNEKYTLQLRNAKNGKTHECDYPEPQWRSIADGSRHHIQVRLIGSAVCETLK